jgi:hypothetical protein
MVAAFDFFEFVPRNQQGNGQPWPRAHGSALVRTAAQRDFFKNLSSR